MMTIDPQLQGLFQDPAALIPAIVQDFSNNEVLMLAYMNSHSLALTLSTGKATYWSRSRNEIWVKGATSGHFQEVHSIDIDCDADAILLKVTQIGAACHTGDRSCFHTPLEIGQ